MCYSDTRWSWENPTHATESHKVLRDERVVRMTAYAVKFGASQRCCDNIILYYIIIIYVHSNKTVEPSKKCLGSYLKPFKTMSKSVTV